MYPLRLFPFWRRRAYAHGNDVDDNATKKPVFYGGQAVIEGVMMRGPRYAAVSVRRADGRIETVVREAVPWLTAHPFWNKPFLRGAFALFDAMRLGVWGLRWSAAQAMEDAVAAPNNAAQEARQVNAAEASGATNMAAAPPPGKTMGDTTVKGTMGLGLLIGVALFIVLPTLVTGLAQGRLGAAGLNAVEGAIRLALFFGYVWAIGRLDGIYRVFQYHGAEHRTINAHEARAPLTPESVQRFSVIHPRCGTSFMIFVLILATIVYAFFGWHPPLIRLAIRLGLLPIIAGVAYELLRLAGTFRGSAALNAITWPGRFTQRFTTRIPDEQQAAVAIAALNAVFAAEGEARPSAAPELA